MTTVLATVIVLGVLIFVHELGHFWAAKLVDIRVERFSIGFGPRVWGFERGETEYILAAIPLGGYVKMGGMDDEVMEALEGGASDEEGEERVPGPRDFDSKPVWARAFVISAGVIMNMIFAYFGYAFGIAAWGRPVLATVQVGVVEESLLPAGTEELDEIPPGASIERIGDRAVEDWGDVQVALLEAEPGPLTIEFSSLSDPTATVEIEVPGDPAQLERMASAFQPWMDSRVIQVLPGSPAQAGGLEAGDRIVAVEEERVENWYELVEEIQTRPEQEIEMTLERDGSRLVRIVRPDAVTEPDPITGEIREVGRIGIPAPTDEIAYNPVPFSEAAVLGARETWGNTTFILGFLGDLVTGGVSPRSVGSIVTIGEASGQFFEAGIVPFIRFMALFSINLAILNLLPIPVLDGGHLVFLGIEAVRGRAVSIEQRLRWSQVGFFIILGLMVWALSNDVLRLLGI